MMENILLSKREFLAKCQDNTLSKMQETGKEFRRKTLAWKIFLARNHEFLKKNHGHILVLF